MSIAPFFGPAISFIHESRLSGKGVLVHCFAGKSRSATIVCAYLMQYCRMSLASALDTVQAARPEICPNSGFLRQLQEHEVQLIADGILPLVSHSAIPDWALQAAAKRAAAHAPCAESSTTPPLQQAPYPPSGNMEPESNASTRSSGTSTDLSEALDAASVASPTLGAYEPTQRVAAAGSFGCDEEGDSVLYGTMDSVFS